MNIVRLRGSLLSVLSFVLLCSALFAQSPPTIIAVNGIVQAGGQFDIRGTFLDNPQSNSTITLNGVAVVADNWADTAIYTVHVPANATPGAATLQITTPAGTSNIWNVTIIPLPNITSISPASGPLGTEVTITGTNFGSQQGQGAYMNAVGAMTVVSWSDTQIVATVPSNAISQTIYVVAAGGPRSNDSQQFTVVSPPTITGVNGIVQAGGQFNIVGTFLDNPQGNSVIKLNGVAVVADNWADTVIYTVHVPTNTAPGPATLQVTTPSGTSNTWNVTVIPLPNIASISPASGPLGTQVTIVGTNFGAQQGQGAYMNAVGAMSIVSWSDTQIVATVPSNAISQTIYVVAAGGPRSNDSQQFTVVTGPQISSLSANAAAMGTWITISGLNFGSAQGSGTVAFNGVPAAIGAWSDAKVVAAVPANATSGGVILTNNAGQPSNAVNFTVNAPTAGSPVLQVSVSDTPLQVNLTSPNNLDWIHWGRISSTTPDRKAGVTPLITDYTPFSGGQANVGNGVVSYSWSDGNQQATVSGTNTDLQISPDGSGFQITAPADTTVKTLNLYVGVFYGQGVLHASLSDGSAPGITDNSVIDQNIASKVYSIDFRAASAGQTLTVNYVSSNNGYIALEAATLTLHLPAVSVVTPWSEETFTAPATLSLDANASQFDSAISGLVFGGSDGSIFSTQALPYQATWPSVASGHYSVAATATDTTGLSNTSTAVEFDVIGNGGSLSAQRNSVPSSVSLTQPGTIDWVLWGAQPPPSSGGSMMAPGAMVDLGKIDPLARSAMRTAFMQSGSSASGGSGFDPLAGSGAIAPVVMDRKSGVTPFISGYRQIGNHIVYSGNGNLQFVYSDGSLDGSAGLDPQVTVHGLNDGYEISVPADANQRTLTLYVGADHARAKLTAFLSDGSAPVVTDQTLDSPNFGGTSSYAINYGAASPSQTLIVRYTLDYDYGGGDVGLMGAALSGPALPPPTISSVSPNPAMLESQVAMTGNNFGIAQGRGVVTFNNIKAVVNSWSDTQIVAVVPTGAADGDVVVTTGGAVSSVGVAFTVAPPVLNSVVPSAVVVGTEVTVNGAGFGKVQGSGSVSFNGLSATVLSWSNTSIVAIVPAGATSGSVVVTSANGQASNPVSFGVFTTLPEIVGVAPLQALPGELITVSGLSFGAVGASSSVLIDDQPSAPFSWSDTQVKVLGPVAAGLHSVVVVNAYGVASEAMQFRTLALGAIDGKVTSNGSPVQGATIRGAFGRSAISDANGDFTLSSVAAGTYSLGVTATGYVPAAYNQITVNAGQITEVHLALTQPNPVTISIGPSSMNLMLGMGTNLALYDQNGMAVVADSWSIDDPSVAELNTTGNQPQVTAVGEGTTTVHATYQNQQLNASIAVVSSGSMLKSVTLPGNSFAVQPNVTLASSGVGPDIVWSEDGNLNGARFDGGLVWRRPLLPDPPLNLAADEQGDFVAIGSSTIAKYSGSDGLPQWASSRSLPQQAPFAVDRQGNVYTFAAGDTAISPAMVELDSDTGRVVRTLNIPKTYFKYNNSATCYYQPNELGQIYVEPDGSAQALVAVWSKTTPCAPGGFDVFTEVKSLYRVGFDSSGNPFLQQLDSAPYEAGFLTGVTAGTIVPDAEGDVIASWSSNRGSGTQYHFLNTTTGTKAALDNLFGGQQTVLGSTGILYYYMASVYADSDPYVASLTAIDPGSFAVLWRRDLFSLLGSSTATPPTVKLETGTPDGGVVALINNDAASAAFRFDPQGNIVPDPALISASEYLGGSDGTLWLQYGAGPQGQALEMSDPHDLIALNGNSLSVWPGSFGMKKANDSAPPVQFVEAQTCSGFDGSIKPSVLVVPQDYVDEQGLPHLGTNQVKLQLDKSLRGAGLLLVSDTATVTACAAGTNGTQNCSGTPTVPATDGMIYTVFGGPSAGLARLKVEDAGGTKVYSTLRVGVKPRLTYTTDDPGVSASYLLDLYQVTESVENIASIAPSATSVKAELDRTFLKQANINMQVCSGSPLSIHYDTMLNGPHNTTDKKLQQPTKEAGSDLSKDPNGVEALNIAHYVQDPTTGILGKGIISTSHQMAFYVHDINPINTSGFAASLIYVRDKGMGPAPTSTTTGGFSQDGTSFDIKMTQTTVTTSTFPYTQENVTAHELGHVFLLNHDPSDVNALMWKESHNQCVIHAFVKGSGGWHTLNPTDGEVDYDPQTDKSAAEKNKKLHDDDDKVISTTTVPPNPIPIPSSTSTQTKTPTKYGCP